MISHRNVVACLSQAMQGAQLLHIQHVNIFIYKDLMYSSEARLPNSIEAQDGEKRTQW